MTSTPEEILAILDRCSESYSFPLLDHPYVYLAASRLSLFRSATDWAIVFEMFGFAPRGGLPETEIRTIASRLHDRDSPDKYNSKEAYESYLANNPHVEFRSVRPVEEGPWQDEEDQENVADGEGVVVVRDRTIPLPPVAAYAKHDIELEDPEQVQVYELCRYLADVAREQVLATPTERRVSVLPEMEQILQLEEWRHPDLYGKELPSGSETFQQLARVLVSGDVSLYQPTQPPNNHWRNWPGGGSM